MFIICFYSDRRYCAVLSKINCTQRLLQRNQADNNRFFEKIELPCIFLRSLSRFFRVMNAPWLNWRWSCERGSTDSWHTQTLYLAVITRAPSRRAKLSFLSHDTAHTRRLRNPYVRFDQSVPTRRNRELRVRHRCTCALVKDCAICAHSPSPSPPDTTLIRIMSRVRKWYAALDDKILHIRTQVI